MGDAPKTFARALKPVNARF